MNNILCIGEALIDMICTDKGKPLSEGENFLKKAGGAPFNVAAAIAALGGQVSLAAKVGNDPFGQHLVKIMDSFGVDTQWVLRDPHYFTTFAFVSLMENGERDFYFNRGADGQLSLHDLQGLDLTAFPIVHFGSATGFLPGPLQDAYAGIFQHAMQQNCFISFDPNYRHLLFKDNQKSFIDQSWNFIRHCHFFKVSDEEAMLLTSQYSVEEAAYIFKHHTRATFAITLGKDGTMLSVNGETSVIPSIPVNPVDTTGAGDAFTGAILSQLQQCSAAEIHQLSTFEWHQMISNANKAGARTCEYLGAMEAFRHLSREIFS